MSTSYVTENPDSLMDSIKDRISTIEFEKASREAPWDGYGGLVAVCDDYMFREEGFSSVFIPRTFSQQPSTISMMPNTDSECASSLGNAASFEKDFASTRSPTTTTATSHYPSHSRSWSHDGTLSGALSGTFQKSDTHKPNTPQSISIVPERPQGRRVSIGEIGPIRAIGSFEARRRSAEASRRSLESSKMSLEGSRRSIEASEQSLEASRPIPESMDVLESKVEEEKESEGISFPERLNRQLQSLRNGSLAPDQRRIRTALVADQAFRAAAGRLQEGSYVEAVQLAEIAAAACPPDKSAARDKINRLKQVAVKRLQTHGLEHSRMPV